MKTHNTKLKTAIPFISHGLGLPPGRVYSILTYTTLTPNVGTLETVYTTKNSSAFTDVLQQLAAITRTKPKLRAATLGNSRRVGVVAIDDPDEAAELVKRGRLPGIPEVGYEFASIREAGETLGFSARTLQAYFYRARSRSGSDAPVVVRGIRLAFTDIPGWQEMTAGARPKRIPGPRFDDVGGKKTPAEVREKLARLEAGALLEPAFKSDHVQPDKPPVMTGPVIDPRAGRI